MWPWIFWKSVFEKWGGSSAERNFTSGPPSGGPFLLGVKGFLSFRLERSPERSWTRSGYLRSFADAWPGQCGWGRDASTCFEDRCARLKDCAQHDSGFSHSGRSGRRSEGGCGVRNPMAIRSGAGQAVRAGVGMLRLALRIAALASKAALSMTRSWGSKLNYGQGSGLEF